MVLRSRPGQTGASRSRCAAAAARGAQRRAEARLEAQLDPLICGTTSPTSQHDAPEQSKVIEVYWGTLWYEEDLMLIPFETNKCAKTQEPPLNDGRMVMSGHYYFRAD